MVAEHRVDVATQLFAQTRHALEAGHAIAVGAPAVVARQHTKVIVEVASAGPIFLLVEAVREVPIQKPVVLAEDRHDSDVAKN